MRDNDRPFTMPDSYYDPPEDNLCRVCAEEEGVDLIEVHDDETHSWVKDPDFDWSEFTRLCSRHAREAKDAQDSDRCDDID